MKKKILPVLAANILVILSFTGFATAAQEKYPERTIQAIVGYPPGSPNDVGTRFVADFLKKYLEQTVVVLNKPGGAGAIAGNELFKSKTDGYTIGSFNNSQLTPELQLNPQRFLYKSGDLVPVAQWGIQMPAFFASYNAPFKTFKEFVEYARKNPNTVKWGNAGKGRLMWILGSLVFQQAGIKPVDVTIEGDAELMAALLGNNIDVCTGPLGPINLSQTAAKKVRPLALITQKRMDILPDVPTTKELGYPVPIPEPWQGIFVPKGTAPEKIAILSSAMKRVTDDPQFKGKFNEVGFAVQYQAWKEFNPFVEDYGRIVWNCMKELGIVK